MRALRLFKGIWFAGVTRPSLVSRDVFEKGLRLALPMKLAPDIINFRWHTRDNPAPSVDPHQDPAYRDDWNEWFSVEFYGEATDVKVPDTLSWIVGLPGDPEKLRPDPRTLPAAPSSPAPSSPAPSSPAPSSPTPRSTTTSPIDGTSGLLILVLLYALSKRRSA